MNYPLISEYVEAVKSAEDNLNELTYLRPVLDGDGNPVMSSGNFAVVFKMRSERNGSLYALKCFTKEQPGRDESYKLIADELECVQPTYLAKVRYIDKELFVDTQNSDETEFPILLMDWVEGVTLDNYIRLNINDRYALDLLAYNFSRLAMWLLPQPFAHGDLKPDNILVREDGSLTLVDYDGMYVPAMQGQKARELGSPDFRHPLRTGDDFNEHIDDFPAVSILLSLKLIAQNPDLLNTYGASDRLLFSESDYRDLSSCALLKQVYPSPSPDINTLVSLFTIANTHKNLSQVSFRLLAVEKPLKPKAVVEEVLSTEVIDEDLAEAITDVFGAKYSKDWKKLLSGVDINGYKIREGTTVICDRAFWRDEAYLELIGWWEESLQEISIPNSVTSIGDHAFGGCSSLREISIPNSVTHISGNPFAGCNCFVKSFSKYFIFENNVLYNADKTTLIAFISKQETFSIPNSVTGIGDSAFSLCSSLQEITIPNTVTNIGNSAFSRCCSLQKIAIPNSVTNISDHAFNECRSLRKITIPNSVTSIGDSAFRECSSLQRIAIPNSVKSIGDSAFRECSSLQRIAIPNSVKSIGDRAFLRCESLQEISIPSSVTHINGNPFSYCNCIVKSFSKHFIFENNVLYNADKTTLIAFISEQETFIIPNSVTSIGNSAFYGCESLQEISIPNSVTSIGDHAFSFCRSLQKISIPDSVTSIGDSAFYVCESLQEISIPNSVTSIGNSAFEDCTSLQEISIPNSVTNIGNSAFADCNSLQEIAIPNSVTSIGYDAFVLCNSLREITMPNSVTSIGYHAFAYCHSLRKISIPNSVTSIGDWGFKDCEALQEIIIPQGSRAKYEELLLHISPFGELYKFKLVER